LECWTWRPPSMLETQEALKQFWTQVAWRPWWMKWEIKLGWLLNLGNIMKTTIN
jgi:hypothetical protein